MGVVIERFASVVLLSRNPIVVVRPRAVAEAPRSCTLLPSPFEQRPIPNVTRMENGMREKNAS